VQIDHINRIGIVELYIVFKTSGSIKERTRTEMGISCQRNGHWHGPWHGAATNHLSVSRLRQGGVPERAVH